MNVTVIQFVHSNTTIPESLLHSITHITHVLLTQICSIVSFGDKHQSPEDGDSLKKKDGSLQSSKSTIISSEQPETQQIYIDPANTPSSCYWSVSNLQKAQLASRTCISSLIIVRTYYSGQSFCTRNTYFRWSYQEYFSSGCSDVITRFLCQCSSGWPRTWALAASVAWCILRGEEFPLISALCVGFCHGALQTLTSMCWNADPTFPDWILPNFSASVKIPPSIYTRWFSESAMDLLYVHGGHLEYFNCDNTGCTNTVMVLHRHFVKVRTTLALLITVWWAHLIKKRAPNCVFLFPEGYLLVVYSLSLPLLAQMSVPVCSFIPSPLFVHHHLLLWGSYCLCLFSCSTHGSKTYSLFRRDSKVVVFLYSVVSVGFFPSQFSFLTHVFHHQPSCPQHNPAESYKMSILSEEGGETEQAW